MSYILEALKKAQSERQLGTLPSIHAPALRDLDGTAAAAVKRPLWLALGLMTLVAVALLVLMWRQSWQNASAVRPAPPSVPVTMPAPLPAAARASAAAPIKAALRTRAAALAPVPALKQPEPAAQVLSAPPPQTRPAPASVVEDAVPSLRELPETLQRQIPPLAIGGYIYSKNPADRLLLIDNVLRHEGEELGPGLTLETLQPKSAVFNYKGYRYRVLY